MKRARRVTKVTTGGESVFADLGFDAPEIEQFKSELVARIGTVITELRLTQTAAGKLMGIDQPKVSALLQGRFGGYSVDRLLRFLTALDQDVEVVIRKKPSGARRGRLNLKAA